MLVSFRQQRFRPVPARVLSEPARRHLLQELADEGVDGVAHPRQAGLLDRQVAGFVDKHEVLGRQDAWVGRQLAPAGSTGQLPGESSGPGRT
jgi:hypothetical protein